MITVQCLVCEVSFRTYTSPGNCKKYCSKECFYKKPSEELYNWKGDEASYRAIHNWVRRVLGKPTDCTMCGNSRKAKRLEWSNVSGQYKREFKDWVQLCSKCHHQVDRQYRKQKGNRIYERLS